MERYMYQDDSFERMLKQKADEYRMYPSSQIWDNIQNRVQKKNHFINLKSASLTALLLTTFSLYISSNQETGKQNAIASLTNESNQTIAKNDRPTADFSQKQVKAFRKMVVVHGPNTDLPHQIDRSEESVLETNKQIEQTSISEPIAAMVDAAEVQLNKATIEPIESNVQPDLTITSNPETKQEILVTSAATAAIATTEEAPELKTDAELNYEVNIPVVTKQKPAKLLQVYFTPSSSYRVLYADNKLTFGNLPQQDPENAAIHSPALGIEAGALIIFPSSNRVKFRTGVQFNYTHYKVEAFKAAPQLTTIRLNYSSIQRISALNNNSGFYARDVANETYQISIPLGLEIRLAGNQKVQWNMATDLQPSYLLKASGYLLTNDLKNYVKAPDLLSHLNLNSSIGTFLRWQAGDFLLQAGPQLRYQLFSNARGEYPIREHLVEYGFHFGVIKTLR